MPNLDETITDIFEMEERVCSALAPYVTRYRKGDFPFINGYRVAFKVLPRFPWECSGGGDYPLNRMSDIAINLYLCMLVPRKRMLVPEGNKVVCKKNVCLFSVDRYVNISGNSPDFEFEPPQVRIWADVVNAVAAKLIPSLRI